MVKRIRRHARAAQKGRPQSRLGASYSVGYGKPPKQHQFKPGQSGNPRGRPKGAKNTATIINEILNRKVRVRTERGVRKITVQEAMLTGFADRGLKGDTKTAAFLLDRKERAEAAGEEANTDTTPDEREIIEFFLEQYLKKKGEKK
jgi:hypothetical protein